MLRQKLQSSSKVLKLRSNWSTSLKLITCFAIPINSVPSHRTALNGSKFLIELLRTLIGILAKIPEDVEFCGR